MNILKKDELASFPNMIHIEPTNHCNLGCIMCPQPREMQRVKGMMSLDLYKSMIDELKDTPAEFVYLHQFGESLLHKKSLIWLIMHPIMVCKLVCQQMELY